MSELKENATQYEEIDLSKYIVVFITYAKKVAQTLNARVKSYFANLLRSLIIIALLAGLGLTFGIVKKKVFMSTMLMEIKYGYIRNDYIKNIVLDLDQMFNEKNYSLIKNRLSLNQSFSERIKGIDYEYFNKSIDEDSVTAGEPFYLKLYVSDNSILDTMNMVLLEHLENIEHFVRQKKLTVSRNRELLNQLNLDLSQLDTLRKNLEQNTYPRGEVKGFVFGEPIDPINAYIESSKVFEKKLYVQNELEFSESFKIIKPFTPSLKRVDPGPVILGLIGAGLGFLIGFFMPIKKL